MQWGSHIVFVVDKKGNNGNFFTGTEQECKLVKFGIELAGGKANLVKPEVKTVEEPNGELRLNNRVKA